MIRSIAIENSPRTQPCDFCDGADFELVSRFDRRSQPLRTVVCRDCGLVSHETIPSDAEVEAYYAHEYRNDYHGELTPSAHRVIRAWEGARWLLNLVRPYVLEGSEVFEIGAGIGFNVKCFEAEGFRSTGIEPGIGFQQYSRERLQARIQRQSLFDLPATPRCDFILLVHVIEHFNSPRRALEHIHSLLRDNGRLYVECPNLGEPHAAPSKLFHFAHIYNFTPDTLEALAHSCGFSTVACLTEPQGKALRYVFEKGAVRNQTPPHGYRNTLASLSRFDDVTYYARPTYAWHRITRDVRFASNRVFAEYRVRRLLRQLQRTSGGDQGPAQRCPSDWTWAKTG